MSNLQINNTNSFSFGEDYNATHEKNDEFSDIQNPAVPPMAIPQDIPFNPQVNLFVQPVDENNPQINIFEPPANAQFVIETQPNKANSQPVNKNVLLNNTNAQPANMNAQQNKSNNHPKNINAQPNNMNAQPNNMNAQLDSTELDLAIIFKSLSQVMQQYLTKKSLQKSESGQNQINNEPLQGLKNILMNQFFRLYSSPKQNRPAKNKPKVQESQFSNNLKKDQNQNNIKINNLNQKENNNNDSFNQSKERSIHNEININLKELININKLTNLIMLISYEDQKKNQDLMLISYEDQKKNKDLMLMMLKELVKSNKAQQTMLEELIKSNKNQEKINNTLFKSIEKALAFINDNKK